MRDIFSLLGQVQESLHEVLQSMEGNFYIGRRPYHDPANPTRYQLWKETLSSEALEAEAELYQKGYYKYEGMKNMFNVLDTAEKQIHIDDIVTYMKDGTQLEGVVIAIIDPASIQVNPIGEGQPFLILPSLITIKYSFIEKIRNLRSDEELQAILNGAIDRAKAVAETMEKKGKGKRISLSTEPVEDLGEF